METVDLSTISMQPTIREKWQAIKDAFITNIENRKKLGEKIEVLIHEETCHVTVYGQLKLKFTIKCRHPEPHHKASMTIGKNFWRYKSRAEK